MESLDDLADQVAEIERRVGDAIFEAVRDQLRGDDVAARERERQLSRVRRSLAKAESLLRATDRDED
ncbi:MAG: hypothetical protein ACP5PB_02445 [Acidimicrobiales bacterium]